MNRPLRPATPTLFLLAWLCAAAGAQDRPHAGFAYPAGGQQGTAIEVTVGGQYLNRVSAVLVSGTGVTAEVLEYEKPLSRKESGRLRSLLRGLDRQKRTGKPPAVKDAEDQVRLDRLLEMSDLEIASLRRKVSDPRRQPNAQIAETVRLLLSLSETAEPGDREMRLVTPRGLSNPLVFQVGCLPEHLEREPGDGQEEILEAPLPLVVNGQILPGDVDRFRFRAVGKTRLVVAASARRLMPYLADAVPGWFQATLSLEDGDGEEILFVDDFRFHPDPVLFYEIDADGEYVLEIRDSIYRGREDFVYRIQLGELPFVSGIFPMGGSAHASTPVCVSGWNLQSRHVLVHGDGLDRGIHMLAIPEDEQALFRTPFAVDEFPELLEAEPNQDTSCSQALPLPAVINGRVEVGGDRDLFRIDGRQGQVLVAEIQARRLGSPLDSLLRLLDASGSQLAINDDHEDLGAGLTTHHADSRIAAELPADGPYFLELTDTARRGGPAFTYRLKISEPRPDFELRVVPSSVQVRAGASTSLTIYALRRDGFNGEIVLELDDAPDGMRLDGGRVPPGQDRITVTLTSPASLPDEPFRLRLFGTGQVGNEERRRPACPAEDMMQAFIYRHLVPSQQLVAVASRDRRGRPPMRLARNGPVLLRPGARSEVRFIDPASSRTARLRMELRQPPAGIAIRSVEQEGKQTVLVLATDPAQIEPGLAGNLIVDLFDDGDSRGKRGKPPRKARRTALGTLPAIPFRVAGP